MEASKRIDVQGQVSPGFDQAVPLASPIRQPALATRTSPTRWGDHRGSAGHCTTKGSVLDHPTGTVGREVYTMTDSAQDPTRVGRQRA